MHKLTLRIGIAVVTVVVGGLVACQTTEQQFNPGALPQSHTDATPRLNASTYVAHGHLLEQQGRLEQAAEQYRKALELTPDLPAARNRLGITLNKLGQHAEASAEFRAALARQPNTAHLYNNLGFSLYLERRYDEADQALSRAIELQPNFTRAHMNRGLVLAKLKRDADALAAFMLAGSEADAYFNLAVIQTEDRRYADAARTLEQALVHNPDFTEARAQLREVSRLAAAEEALRATAATATVTEAAPTQTASAETVVSVPASETTATSETIIIAAEPPTTIAPADTSGATTGSLSDLPATPPPAPNTTDQSPTAAGENTIITATPPATDARSTGVVLAADVLTVPVTPASGLDADPTKRLLEEMEAVIASASTATPVPTPNDAAKTDELTRLFEQLVAAHDGDPAEYEALLCRVYELLGAPEETH